MRHPGPSGVYASEQKNREHYCFRFGFQECQQHPAFVVDLSERLRIRSEIRHVSSGHLFRPVADRFRDPGEEALPAFPFYLTEKGIGYRKVLEEIPAKRSAELQPLPEISRTDILSDLPEQKGREEKPIRLSVPNVEADIRKQMIHHRNKWISSAMDAFLRFAGEHEFAEP